MATRKPRPVEQAAASAPPASPISPEAQVVAERRRALALELAIKAAPYLLPGKLDKVTGAQLTSEAEHVEAWLKAAKP